VHEWSDHGPVVFFNATVTDWETKTSTSFVCAPTADAEVEVLGSEETGS
jgi:hypothetical protein